LAGGEIEEKFPGKGLVSVPKSVIKLNNLDSLPLIPARRVIRNVPVLRKHLFNFIWENFSPPSLGQYSLKSEYLKSLEPTVSVSSCQVIKRILGMPSSPAGTLRVFPHV